MKPAPFHPFRTVVPGEPGQYLLSRVFRVQSTLDEIDHILILDRGGTRILLRDSGPDGSAAERLDRDTALHLLWARDDDTAHLVVDDQRTAMAPGDSIVLPAGTSWSAPAGLILCEISITQTGTPGVLGPTHGEEVFHGHNRQTTYPAPPGLAIERWKLTQSQSFPDSEAAFAMVDLADPVSLIWETGTDLIRNGECRVIPEGSGPVTVIPNGLGYVLVVKVNGP